jgi:hypothetical protein
MTPSSRNKAAAIFAAQMLAYYMELADDVMTPKDKMVQLMQQFILLLTVDSYGN